ncbi:MAG: hypothetical protein LBP59_13115 [Planctomycetaceae bacterium]|nr:hypothetical protein [Planctomycetaceae bacterium]
MSGFLISSAFLLAFRQSAGGTPAIRWSRLHFRIAGASESQTFRLVFLQICRRHACIPGSRASLKIHFCPARDNMLVEKQGQKYICPARDNM